MSWANRLTRTDTPSVTPPPATTSANTWNYGVANRLLTRPGVTYTYDNNGNTLTKTDFTGTTTYGYDVENRLTSVSTPGGMITSYAYDPFGRRISKTVNGVVTRYLYDGADIVKEYDGTGAVLATYRHGPGIDKPISMTRGGQTYYYHADGLGSITGLTNSGQTVVQNYGYDGFGNLTQAPTVQNPYTYTGREWDQETGLYYYRARYYDPKAGRFLQEDPIGLAGGINLYAYVFNNPLRWTDPTGLEVQVCCRPAEILSGLVSHCWIKTDTMQAGMGTLGNNPPGQEYDLPYWIDVYITDHSNDKPTSCQQMDNVDEQCVNNNLKIGEPLGRFNLFNTCQGFAYSVINSCRPMYKP
jgi:RHS repeat-associated protein